MKRHLDPTVREEILARMGDCRKAMRDLQDGVPIRSATYREAAILAADIDTLAQLITGDPTYFKLKPHG